MSKKEKENIENVEVNNEEHCECHCGGNCCHNEENNACELTNEEVLVLKNTIESLNNKVLMAQAELINYRKRKDEETSNMLKFANMDLILEILPILDNFERALSIKSNNAEFDKFIEGFKLLYSHLKDTLKKYGVEEIETENKFFDPTLHEAVMIGNDDSKEEDMILEVFNKGYILKGRVIRPAKVKVNKID